MKALLGLCAAVILLVTAIFLLSLHGRATKSRTSGLKPPPEFAQILNEIMSVENVTRPPVPGAAGSTLACVSGNEYGRGLYFVDLNNLKRSPVPIKNDIRRVNGWSPDGRYLAFEQKPLGSDNVLTPTRARSLAEDRNESWLTIYDRASGTYSRLTTRTAVNERFFSWLTTNTYFFSRDSDDKDVRGTYWGRIDTGDKEIKASDTLHDFVPMSDRMAAYIKEKDIYSFEIVPSPETNGTLAKPLTKRLSDFNSRGFDSLRWLRYQPKTGLFLFCSRPDKSNSRYLYQFNPADNELKQLNDEDTYNGQWLEEGTGYAYIGNTNNSFFLVLRPGNPADHTNLFTQGSIANYTVDSNGERLFATASLGIEPQGLWEYNIKTHALRQVVPGASKPFNVTKLVDPEEKRVKSFDGLEIPYFLFKPLAKPASANRAAPLKTKHPVVILIPPRSFQFQRSFEARSQMFVNLGFYFVAVNYRGCDGYGREYASFENIPDEARDVLAVYNELMTNPEVDRENVFIWASSFGSMVASELLATKPELWRGMGFGSPVECPWDKRFQGGKFPSVIIMSGDQDENLPSLREFQEQAAAHGVDLKLIVKKNASHILYNPDDLKDNRRLFVEFFYEHMKP